jgi:outer membrane receptor for ferrienterochelin and colicins
LRRRDHPLTEAVITGLGKATALNNALSTYQVISRAAMNAQGATTVSEALRTQLNISTGSDNMLGSTTSLQGLKGDKVKVLIDGMPVNGREGGEIDLGQLSTNNVARIEVIQGPMGVVFGSDALGGVINIITNRPQKPLGVQASAYYESIGRYNTNASVSARLSKKHQLTFGGGRNFFEGYDPLDPLGRSYRWWPKRQVLGNGSYEYLATSGFKLRLATDLVFEKLSNKDGHYYISPFKAYAFDQYFLNRRANTRLQLNGKIGKRGLWQSQTGYAWYHRTKNL